MPHRWSVCEGFTVKTVQGLSSAKIFSFFMSVPVCLAAGGSVHRNLKNILEWWKNVKGVDMFGNQQIFVTQFSLNPVWEWNCILRQAEGFSFVMLSVAIFQKMLCHWGWKWRSWNSWSFFFFICSQSGAGSSTLVQFCCKKQHCLWWQLALSTADYQKWY